MSPCFHRPWCWTAAVGAPCGHHPPGHADAAAVPGEVFAQAGVERRGADPPADLSVGDPEDQGLRVKVGRPEGQQVFERRTSRRAPLAPAVWWNLTLRLRPT